jgi:hypothetical protein
MNVNKLTRKVGGELPQFKIVILNQLEATKLVM